MLEIKRQQQQKKKAIVVRIIIRLRLFSLIRWTPFPLFLSPAKLTRFFFFPPLPSFLPPRAHHRSRPDSACNFIGVAERKRLFFLSFFFFLSRTTEERRFHQNVFDRQRPRGMPHAGKHSSAEREREMCSSVSPNERSAFFFPFLLLFVIFL